MGFMSSRIALTCSLAATVLLSACSKDAQQTPEDLEVNTLNIYFSQVQENGNPVGKVFAHNRSSGIQTEIASYTAGENMAVTMDTDEDEPGLDMAAIVDGNTLRVINYKIDAIRRVTSIQTFSSDICGIYPSKIPAESWIDATSNYFKSAIDDTAVFVALKTNNSCDEVDVAYQYVKFDLDNSEPVLISRYSSGVRLNGAYLYDSAYRGFDPDINDNAEGRILWVGYDKDRQSLSIQTPLGISLAEASLVFVNDPPIIQSPNDGLVVVQLEGNLYKLTLGSISSILEAGEQASANNLLDNLLSIPITNYTLADESQPLKLSSELNDLAFADDDALYQVNLQNNAVTSVYTFPNNLDSIQFAQTRNGSIAASKVFSSHSTMSLFSTDSGVSEAIIVPQADFVNFRVDDTNFFINTYNATSIGGVFPDAGSWTAAKTELNNVTATYPNSQLIFLDGRGDTNDDILIQASYETNPDGTLTKPSLFIFDSTNDTGVTVFVEENEEEESVRVLSAALGTFSFNARAALNDRLGSDYILNPRHAGFILTDETNYYGVYLDPQQGSSIEEAEGARETTRTSIIDVTAFDPVISYFSGFFPDFAELNDFRTTP